MSYQEYVTAVTAASDAHPSWRLGQAYFNVLADANPALADSIRGSDLDPFYNDDVLPALVVWLQGSWPHQTPPPFTPDAN
jgi:hypothetical protein